MLKQLLCLALMMGLGCAGLALTQPSALAVAGQDDDQRIAELVKKLGSMNYADREKAKKDLEGIGMPALEQLRGAAKTGDVEIRTRCEKLVEKLEAKRIAQGLLTPKKVRLNVKGAAVLVAIEELQKISGYPIVIEGDRAPLTKRTVTLDTGEVTFWEAFDFLCEKGNLTQGPTGVASSGTVIRRTPVPPPVPGKLVPPAKGGGLQRNDQIQMQIELPPGGGNAPPAVVLPVQAQPAPVQIQMQVQVQPGKTIMQPGRQPFYPAGSIVVRDGAFAKVPTCYSGSVRIRLLPVNQASEIAVQPPQSGESVYIMDACAEPRLQMFAVTGSPSLQLALDDLGQELALGMEPMPDLNAVGAPVSIVNRSVCQGALRLQQGAKQAAQLAELKGAITIEALTPAVEALIAVGDLAKAAGKKVEGAKGGSIEIRTFEKQADGTYKVQVTFQAPQPFYAVSADPAPVGAVSGTAVQRMPANGQDLTPKTVVANQARFYPQLVDAKGKVLTLEQIPQRSARSASGVIVQELTMVFRAGDGVGEPTQAILFGHRKVTAEAPFAFKQIPLQH
jgi:hypothetical protein